MAEHPTGATNALPPARAVVNDGRPCPGPSPGHTTIASSTAERSWRPARTARRSRSACRPRRGERRSARSWRGSARELVDGVGAGRRGPRGRRRLHRRRRPPWPGPPARGSSRTERAAPRARAAAPARARRCGSRSSRAEGDLIVWCDADITNFDARFVDRAARAAAAASRHRVREGLLRPAGRRQARHRRARHRAGGPAADLAAVPPARRHRAAAVGRVRAGGARCSRRCRSCRATASTSAC